MLDALLAATPQKASEISCKNDYSDTNIFWVEIYFRSITEVLSEPKVRFLGCLTIHYTRGNPKKVADILCKNNYFDKYFLGANTLQINTEGLCEPKVRF